MVHPFEIVADPVRRRILEIVAVGTHPAGLVADVVTHEFGISRSAVSHQLRTLREAGAVDVMPNDQERLYILEESFLHELDDAVGELFELWDHRYGYGTDRAPLPPTAPSRTPQRHRLGRKGLRGRR
jgi:DNA-binding transcriptional ArsR family regulator